MLPSNEKHKILKLYLSLYWHPSLVFFFFHIKQKLGFKLSLMLVTNLQNLAFHFCFLFSLHQTETQGSKLHRQLDWHSSFLYLHYTQTQTQISSHDDNKYSKLSLQLFCSNFFISNTNSIKFPHMTQAHLWNLAFNFYFLLFYIKHKLRIKLPHTTYIYLQNFTFSLTDIHLSFPFIKHKLRFKLPLMTVTNHQNLTLSFTGIHLSPSLFISSSNSLKTSFHNGYKSSKFSRHIPFMTIINLQNLTLNFTSFIIPPLFIQSTNSDSNFLSWWLQFRTWPLSFPSIISSANSINFHPWRTYHHN